MKLQLVKLLLTAVVSGMIATAHMSTLAQNTTTARTAREVSADVQRGQVLYETHCTACHAIDANRTGPMHRGVIGRRAGTAPGYDYSEELAKSSVVWTPKTVEAWLTNPEKLIPGQRMGFQLDSRKDRTDVIAYLVTLR